MRMVLRAAGFTALVAAHAVVATAQTPQQQSHSRAPFVEIGIRGTDVVSSPERIRYRYTADPGTYVTIFEVAPRGWVSLLNRYDSPVRGARRSDVFRETVVGDEGGEGYLVAVATRTEAQHRQLLRRSIANAKLSRSIIGAEASLNDLLTNFLPTVGDDLGIDYVSFRVLASRSNAFLSDDAYCPILFAIGVALPQSRTSYWEYPDAAAGFGSRSRLALNRLCYDPDAVQFLAGRPRVTAPPVTPEDTAPTNGAPPLQPPRSPRMEPPVISTPRPGDTSEPGIGGTSTGTDERSSGPAPTFSAPAPPTPPVTPIPPVIEPTSPPPPRPVPIEPQRADPPTEASRPVSPLGREDVGREPVTPEAPAPPPPPPAPAPPSPPVPVKTEPPPPPPPPPPPSEEKVAAPSTIPPLT